MNYYDEKLLMRHLNSLNNSDIQTPYYNKICEICNSLNSPYFNIDGSLKLKHKYNTPKIELRSIMDSVPSTPVQYTPIDVKSAQEMYDIWIEHEQDVEEGLHEKRN